MRDLHGWGTPLWAGGKEELVKSVEDHGLFRFIPNLFGRQTGQRLVWRSPTAPRKEHQILTWSDLSREPQRSGTSQVICEKDGVAWRLPNLGDPVAMAVTYDGMRLGSWFHSERALKTLKSDPSSHLFATLRWLKIPVLNEAWCAVMREAVLRNPVEFLRGWLNKEALPHRLSHRNAEDGVEVVVRELLWNYSDPSRWRVEALATALPTQPLREGAENEIVALERLLTRLGDLCPSLAYNLARAKGQRCIKPVRAVAVDLVSRPEPIGVPQLFSMAARNCAALVDGATQQEIENAVRAYADQLDKGAPAKSAFYLRRLGETVSGRRYITAALLLGLSERGVF